ncbi:lysophospholipase BODYGUARD 4 [Vigna angularis]|uniref:Lysophospholipase BODYGUARD 4 n=1 Tax=Phaseolus angularis TaxID=3914 RepID=A0A8T0KZQ8_PHAAN|nr:lysophospholipase BODYGUARD 4 [Vigna angularis]
MSLPLSSPKWLTNCVQSLIFILCCVVFLIFDLLDSVFCVIYGYIDKLIEGEVSPCCCSNWERQKRRMNVTDDDISDSLYERRNIFREMGFLRYERKREDSTTNFVKGSARSVNRWSDCGCDSCLSWVNDGSDYKLHFVVKEPLLVPGENCKGKPSENVIFLHGFLCSSSFWTETVFPYFSEKTNHEYRLIGIDLLGFGKSPKPRDCSYTLQDHVEMIEKSVVLPLEMTTFHLVAHSMGCIIALALAAKYPKNVKSITLVAPPYTSSEGDACLNALSMLAGKKLWSPLSFGSSFMSWDLHFLTTDMTRHTHHSAWSSMHNVLCGGAKFVDSYLIILTRVGVRINVIQGEKDQVVPMECCSKFELKAPEAEINIIPNANHGTVLFGREKEFALSLEHIWESCC